MGMDRKLRKKRFRLKWLGGLAVLILAPIVFIYQVRHADRSPAIYVKKSDLRFFETRTDEFQEYINIIGRVVSSRTSYIDTLETGTVKALFVEEGDLLIKGRTVLVMENNQLETALKLKEDQIEEKKLSLQTERLLCDREELSMQEGLLDIDHKLSALSRDYRQNKKLYDTARAISKNDLEKIREGYEYWQKKREILRARHQLKRRLISGQIAKSNKGLEILNTERKRLMKRIDNLTIKVATDGLLVKLDASVGEIKPAGSRIAQFDVVTPLKIESKIDEYYLNKVHVNDEGRFDIEQARGDPDTGYAVVTMITPEVENNMFTVDLKFRETSTARFRIGQTFDMRLALGKAQKVVIIKKGPFVQDTGGNWVYVVNTSKTKAKKRRIRVGRQNPEYLEVIEGLDSGETVIISRYDAFENLSEIRIN